MNKLKKGVLVLFEGGESCGKSTQRDLCFDYFSSKYETVKMREPGSAPISEGIRDLLLNRAEMKMSNLTELLLFEAARTQFVEDLLKPALEQGRIVLCDRYYYSTIAYQGFGRGIDLNTIEILNGIASQGIKPDLAFIFDISYEESMKRKQKANLPLDRIEMLGKPFHDKVRQGYLYIAKDYPNTHLIEESLGIQEANKEIVEKIEEKLNSHENP